mmetsp:Transcript_41406/g.127971  ORF Transcript_41406/g.127971 Transcript_41406/m.127971 type:complete len:231 (-) Transcript_41406:591-1283(-)
MSRVTKSKRTPNARTSGAFHVAHELPMVCVSSSECCGYGSTARRLTLAGSGSVVVVFPVVTSRMCSCDGCAACDMTPMKSVWCPVEPTKPMALSAVPRTWCQATAASIDAVWSFREIPTTVRHDATAIPAGVTVTLADTAPSSSGTGTTLIVPVTTSCTCTAAGAVPLLPSAGANQAHSRASQTARAVSGIVVELSTVSVGDASAGATRSGYPRRPCATVAWRRQTAPVA